MSTELIHIGIECGVALVCILAVTFILNRLGFDAWVSWSTRSKTRTQDSSARRYWNAHQ
jgi:hypothetical protein